MNGPLENEDVWLGDGTFAVVPTIFFQLYTIHARVGNNYPPCVYFLLPNKTQNTYVKMLEALNTLLPQANPQVILADFENAAQWTANYDISLDLLNINQDRFQNFTVPGK